MARELEIKIGADVKKAVRGLEDVEDSLDDIIKHLDRLAEEGDETAASLARDMRSAANKVESAGKDMTKGLSKGFDEAKGEAGQSGREAAASFSGGFDDVGDFVQETLANAMGGFGPLGAAAGIAFAATFGAVMSTLADQQERLEAVRDAASDLASTLYENGGTLPITEQVDLLIETLTQERAARGLESLIDGFSDLGTNLDSFKRAAKLTDTDLGELLRTMGSRDAGAAKEQLKKVNDELDKLYEAREKNSHGLFPDIQPLETLKGELEKTVAIGEAADATLSAIGQGYDSEAYRAQVTAIGDAWTDAATDASDYITEQDGVTSFDWSAYLANAEATLAAANDYKRKIVVLPPDIANEAKTIFASQGAQAANAYIDAYNSADAGNKGRFEAAAKANSGAVGKAAGEELAKSAEAAAKAKAQGWGNTFPPVSFDTKVDDTAVRNYVPPRKTQYVDYKARQVL